MAIVEIIGGPITHKYLMGKTKFELAEMYMRLLRETERDAKDAALYRAQRAPQNGAVPEGWEIEVAGKHVRVTRPDGILSEWYSRPKNGSGMYDLCLALAAPAPETSKCGPACARCGSTTGAACSDHGCHYLTAGNGAPEAERPTECHQVEVAIHPTIPNAIRVDIRSENFNFDRTFVRPEEQLHMVPEGVEALARSIYEAWRAERFSALPSAHPWEAVSPFTQELWKRIARRHIASAQRADAGKDGA